MQVLHKMQPKTYNNTIFCLVEILPYLQTMEKSTGDTAQNTQCRGFYLIRILPFIDRTQEYRTPFSVFLHSVHIRYTAQKIKFSMKDFFSKCDQVRSFLRIWSHLLKKSLIENFIFCAVVIHRPHKTPGSCIFYLGMFSLYSCFMSHDLTKLTR